MTRSRSVSSLAARSVSVFGSAAYTSAKAGLLGFSRHLFLVSDAASFITGATIDVNGGQLMV
jgi:NAD(P)-dependent dehydrogenase (short-subunit alcohol dehydrogenase family)